MIVPLRNQANPVQSIWQTVHRVENQTLHGVRRDIFNMEHLKPPTEMVFSTDDGSSIAEKWRCWRQAMELYLNLSISDKKKCAVFLYVIGSTGRDIYNSMVFGDEQDKINKKFEDYCKPKQNIAVERCKFNMRLQNKSETIDQFVTALRLLAKECNFKELHDELIRDRIVCGITSDRVKEQLLREQDLTTRQYTSVVRRRCPRNR